MDEARVADLVGSLRATAGKANVLTEPGRTASFSRGYRYGGGRVAAVVRPADLVTMWRTLQVCAQADAIVIIQAANTGLTGGSTPDGDDYDRPVVIVSTTALDAIHLINAGRQVVCLPGATLHALEAKLAPIGREPHSVIGSSCIGASVVGGVCNNSGGALIRRGPAYTELALYARMGTDRRLRLVNHLGIELPGDPEAMLNRVERGAFRDEELLPTDALASDADYESRVRDVDAATPARFNGDVGRLFEAAGSAGRIAVFAVRLDTFAADRDTATFYVGTNAPSDLTALRRHVLSTFEHLPIAAEYMHRDCFDIAARYGKDTFLAISWLGARRLPTLFRLKTLVDRWAARLRFRSGFSDRALQRLSRLYPAHLPRRILSFRQRFAHHLILKVPQISMYATASYLAEHFRGDGRDHFRCTHDEAIKAFNHRFAAAGAAVRYKAVHGEAAGAIVALDVALRRDDPDWFEGYPSSLSDGVAHALHYGHFFCHVFHQDYILQKDADAVDFEHAMWARFDARGAEYPAEHNVGHAYSAKAPVVQFYRSLDPRNSFNPGIGKTSRALYWAE